MNEQAWVLWRKRAAKFTLCDFCVKKCVLSYYLTANYLLSLRFGILCEMLCRSYGTQKN